MSEEKERYVVMSTKVSPWVAEVWDAVCNALETDTYNMLQLFILSMIRAANQRHSLSPQMEKLVNMLDLDVGWQKAINICAPNGKFSIAQMILIVEQEGKEGFDTVMLDKPFMGDCQQTECADQIFERVVEVIFRKTYLRLRRLGQQMHVKSQRELLEKMIDEQLDILQEESDREEMQGVNDYATNSRRLEYGKKTKSTHHHSPEEYIEQGVISFADDESYVGEDGIVAVAESEEAKRVKEAEESRVWLDEHDCPRPFGYEE